MARAAPKGDYAGAVFIFSAAAVFASLLILAMFGGSPYGFGSTRSLFAILLQVGVAGLSAAVSCLLLRPLARRLARHQYLLRPFIMGSAVVALSYALFGVVIAFTSELWDAWFRAGDHFDGTRLQFKLVMLSYVGFLMTWVISVPLGILAAYCVEIVGWFREDAENRKRSGKVPDDLAKMAE